MRPSHASHAELELPLPFSYPMLLPSWLPDSWGDLPNRANRGTKAGDQRRGAQCAIAAAPQRPRPAPILVPDISKRADSRARHRGHLSDPPWCFVCELPARALLRLGRQPGAAGGTAPGCNLTWSRALAEARRERRSCPTAPKHNFAPTTTQANGAILPESDRAVKGVAAGCRRLGGLPVDPSGRMQ